MRFQMGAAAESEAAAGGDSNPPGRALGGASSADVASAAARRGRRILATATVNVFLGKRGGWGVEGGRVGGFGRWLNNGLEGNSKIDVRVFPFFDRRQKKIEIESGRACLLSRMCATSFYSTSRIHTLE